MQKGRLFKIVYYLLDKGVATSTELAEKFEVSVRTIYRDIDALSEAGIPIYAESGRNGGIHLMKEFILDKAVFSKEEKQEILSALQSMNTAQSLDDNSTLQKLSAIFNLNSENWLEIDFSRWGSNNADSYKFEILKSAVINRNRLKILYANSYGEITERIICPLKMKYKSMSWYLKAYCNEKNDYRIFKLNRIIDFKVLNETFEDYVFPEEVLSEKNYTKIILRFSERTAYRVYDEFDNTQIKKDQNGNLIVTVNMPEDDWLIGYLLSFGTQVDIISPQYLSKLVAEEARKIYYKNKS